MNTPTIYTATPADLSPPFQTDSFCVDLVLATDYQKLKDEFAALAAENVGMDGFVEEMLAIAWQGGSTDGSDIQELALKHGLIRQEVYCADKHENCVYDPGNFDDGDAVYFRTETPATDRIVAGIKADGVEMFVEKCREESMRAISSDIRNNWWLAGEHAEDFAAQLLEVAK